MVEASLLLSWRMLVWPWPSLKPSELLLITEDTTRMLKLKLLTSRDWMITSLNLFFSQTKKERTLSRTVRSQILPPTSSRTSSKTLLHQYLLSQLSITLSKLWPSPRKWQNSRHTKNSDTRELTNITKVRDRREQRTPRLPRNDQFEESQKHISKMCFIDFITSCLSIRSYGDRFYQELIAIKVLSLEWFSFRLLTTVFWLKCMKVPNSKLNFILLAWLIKRKICAMYPSLYYTLRSIMHLVYNSLKVSQRFTPFFSPSF